MDKYELENRFKKHKVSDADQQLMDQINMMLGAIGEFLNEKCPESREKSLAITKLEEVAFWANASVARH
jgi:hypothetical protein